MEEYIYYNSLYDCYQSLLTEKQKKYFEDYYFENLSLSEIGSTYKISRNAAYKQIKNVVRKLLEYEEKLKLYDKKLKLEYILKQEKDNQIKQMLLDLL